DKNDHQQPQRQPSPHATVPGVVHAATVARRMGNGSRARRPVTCGPRAQMDRDGCSAGACNEADSSFHGTLSDSSVDAMDNDQHTDWLDHLIEQLEMLDASCQGWDQGRNSEAKRIAVSIRTFVHKGTGTPLLEHLGVWDQLLIPSFVLLDVAPGADNKPAKAGMTMVHQVRPGVAAVGIFESGSPPEYWPVALGEANLGSKPNIRLPDWWEEVIMYDEEGAEVTRHQLTLWVANKDGGAHLDPRLPPTYKGLSRLGTLGFQDSFGAPYTANPMPAALRHIGEELRVGIRQHFGAQLRHLARAPATTITRPIPEMQIGGIEIGVAPAQNENPLEG
ncbi:MAG: hypothetical protein ACRERD_05005, partial [Candidatus Binatia bacterium]